MTYCYFNRIYPFIHNNELPKYVNQIRDCLANVEPFEVTMKEFKHFTHKNYNTIWLHPEQDDDVINVQKKISEKFKDPKKNDNRPFCPHLSVGQSSNNETEKKKDMFSKDFDEIKFEVNSVQIITRNGNKPFEVRYTIPFGGGDVIEENVTIFPV